MYNDEIKFYYLYKHIETKKSFLILDSQIIHIKAMFRGGLWYEQKD